MAGVVEDDGSAPVDNDGVPVAVTDGDAVPVGVGRNGAITTLWYSIMLDVVDTTEDQIEVDVSYRTIELAVYAVATVVLEVVVVAYSTKRDTPSGYSNWPVMERNPRCVTPSTTALVGYPVVVAQLVGDSFPARSSGVLHT